MTPGNLVEVLQRRCGFRVPLAGKPLAKFTGTTL